MTAPTPSYPGATHAFPVFTDLTDIIYAGSYNTMASEVTAIEKVLGYNPHLSDFLAYTPSVATASVSQRLGLFEHDMNTRVGVVERLTLNASVRLYLSAAFTYGSSAGWQNVLLPQASTTQTVNTVAPPVGASPGLPVYSNGDGVSRFFSNAPDQSGWALSASITWAAMPSGAPAGLRGMRIVGVDGQIYAQTRRLAIVGDTAPDVMSLQWTGVLPVGGTVGNTSSQYNLTLQVLNTSGQALDIAADSTITPTRADFVRIPG